MRPAAGHIGWEGSEPRADANHNTMKPFIRIVLTAVAASAALVALVVALIPVWLLLRVPGAIETPAPEIAEPTIH